MNQDIHPQDLIPRMTLTQQSIDRTTKPESNANAFFKIGELFGAMTNEKADLKLENQRLRQMNCKLRDALRDERCKCVKDRGMLDRKCARCIALDYTGE